MTTCQMGQFKASASSCSRPVSASPSQPLLPQPLAPARAAAPPPRRATQLQWAPRGRSFGRRDDWDEVPCSTLHCASREGQPWRVRQLLGQGADVNEAGRGGDTPLHAASRADGEHEEVVELLLAAGAEVNAVNESGATPLDGATYQGHGHVASRLLAAGGQVRAPAAGQGAAAAAARRAGPQHAAPHGLLPHGLSWRGEGARWAWGPL